MQALWALGNADVSTANNEVFSSELASVTAEDLFANGLRQLRALQ